MQQTPITKPIIIESLRRLDLIMPIKLFIPGMVPKRRPSAYRNGRHKLPTYHLHHSLVDTCKGGALPCEFRTSFICLSMNESPFQMVYLKDNMTYSRILSVIRWELSIRPRSASRESAAEDL